MLDDVFTTGSTLNEVVRTLSTAAPRQLDALVLAKVPPPYDPSLTVNEKVTKELAPIKADITQLDDRPQNVEIAFGSLTGRIDGVEKQISHATNVTYGLIVSVIIVAIGIPAWRGKRDRD